MKRPLHIGVTGGIGSGKSIVCRIFGCLGVPVYDADSRAKALMATDPMLIAEIQQLFGPESYFSDGSINKTYLAKMVFTKPAELAKLNRAVHPRVAEDFLTWSSGFHDKPYLIKEAALLFEAGTAGDLQAVIVVSAPVIIKIKRVMLRDLQRTEQDVKNIIANQLPEEEKTKRADYVIVNDEQTLIIPQVIKLHEHFLKGA